MNDYDKLTLNKKFKKEAKNTGCKPLIIRSSDPNFQMSFNRIGGVMVSMLPLSTVDRGFDPWSR